MRREMTMMFLAIAAIGAPGCRQSTDARARSAAARARDEAVVRQSATVQRDETPTDSFRILYTGPPPLADSSARRESPAVAP